jgi:hypothetical protein
VKSILDGGRAKTEIGLANLGSRSGGEVGSIIAPEAYGIISSLPPAETFLTDGLARLARSMVNEVTLGSFSVPRVEVPLFFLPPSPMVAILGLLDLDMRSVSSMEPILSARKWPRASEEGLAGRWWFERVETIDWRRCLLSPSLLVPIRVKSMDCSV